MEKRKLVDEGKLRNQWWEQKLHEANQAMGAEIEVLKEAIQRLKSALDVKDKEIESYL